MGRLKDSMIEIEEWQRQVEEHEARTMRPKYSSVARDLGTTFRRMLFAIKRWPIVRHVRWLYLSYLFSVHMDRCARFGLGLFPHPNDLQYLDGVWKGRN